MCKSESVIKFNNNTSRVIPSTFEWLSHCLHSRVLVTAWSIYKGSAFVQFHMRIIVDDYMFVLLTVDIVLRLHHFPHLNTTAFKAIRYRLMP